MQLVDLLTPSRVVADARATSKKRLLESLSKLLDERGTSDSERAIFDSLCRREKLGSTGLGSGVALPHGRTKEVVKGVGAFVRLAEPVDFGSPDTQKVDLVFALVVPEHFTDQHLVLLAQLAQLFSDAELVAALRRARNSAELYALLAGWQERHVAA